MKKAISFLSILLISTIAISAQGFVQFRLEAGPSFNFSKISSLKHTFEKKNKTGYHFGAYVDVPLKSGLYLGSGLTFTMKGGKTAGKNNIADLDITFHYIQIPINVGYRFNLSRSLAIALQTGPYFSVALAGSAKTGIKGIKATYDIFKEGVLGIATAKRFDVGWGVQAMGFFSRYYATVGVDLGLLNVMNGKEKDNATHKENIKDNIVNINTMQCFVGLGICF